MSTTTQTLLMNTQNFTSNLNSNLDTNIANALQSLLNLLGVNNLNLNTLTKEASPVYNEKVNKKNPPRERGKGERMIASAIPFLISYRGLDCQEFSVFFHILARAGNGNGCFESIPNMSARLKLGIKSLRAVIQRLQEYRLIYKAEDRPGYTSVYEVHDESQWMTEEEIEQKRNELKRKKSKPIKSDKKINADIQDSQVRNRANVERIRLAIEDQFQQTQSVVMKDQEKTNKLNTKHDLAQGVVQQVSLNAYPGTIEKKVESDRATQGKNDRGILNIENTNTKKILEREEKKADSLSIKTSLSETERAKDVNQEKAEELFEDTPTGKQKKELPPEQLAILNKWIPSGALKKVFSIRDEDLAPIEEKERKQAEKRQQYLQEQEEANASKRTFGYNGYDEYGHKKTFGQEEKPRQKARVWYAPVGEHPNYPVSKPVSDAQPEVKPEVKPEVQAIPVLSPVSSQNDLIPNEQESGVLEAQIVPDQETQEEVQEVIETAVVKVEVETTSVLTRPVEKPRLAKFDVNDQKLIDRVETYRNAFDQGKTNFTPYQLQEWAAVDGMEPVIKAYRKSGKLLHSSPNDINFEFICWLNNQHSRGSNQKDDGYALNYIRKMERTPSDWSTLMALVAQWQGGKKLGETFGNFRVSKLAELEQQERNLREIADIVSKAGLQWEYKK